MSFSAEAARDLWKRTAGKDPLFAAVDGSNCPNLPQEQEKSHSLLLQRGLIRVFLPVPKNAEFTINVVSDPTGMQHQSDLWTEQSDPYRLRLSTATHGCKPQVRDRPGATYRLEAGRAGGYGSGDRQAGRYEFHGGRPRSHAPHAGTKCNAGHGEAQSVTDEQLQKIVEFEKPGVCGPDFRSIRRQSC
jgi:hypothetical protein